MRHSLSHCLLLLLFVSNPCLTHHCPQVWLPAASSREREVGTCVDMRSPRSEWRVLEFPPSQCRVLEWRQEGSARVSRLSCEELSLTGAVNSSLRLPAATSTMRKLADSTGHLTSLTTPTGASCSNFSSLDESASSASPASSVSSASSASSVSSASWL